MAAASLASAIHLPCRAQAAEQQTDVWSQWQQKVKRDAKKFSTRLCATSRLTPANGGLSLTRSHWQNQVGTRSRQGQSLTTSGSRTWCKGMIPSWRCLAQWVICWPSSCPFPVTAGCEHHGFLQGVQCTDSKDGWRYRTRRNHCI